MGQVPAPWGPGGQAGSLLLLSMAVAPELHCWGQVRRKFQSMGTYEKHSRIREKTRCRTKQTCPETPDVGLLFWCFGDFSNPGSLKCKLRCLCPQTCRGHTEPPHAGAWAGLQFRKDVLPTGPPLGWRGQGRRVSPLSPYPVPRAGPVAGEGRKAGNTQQITLSLECLPLITSLVPPTLIDSICSFCS